MLNKQKLIERLETKKDDFLNYSKDECNSTCKLQQSFNAIKNKDYKEVNQKLKEASDTPGALLSKEWENFSIDKFTKNFNNLEEARQWAYKTLLNKTTYAVDGSQILPNKDYSPPVGAVQVGWFENFHTQEGKYNKDNEIKIITSSDLAAETEDLSMEYFVNYKRFEFEINTITQYMKDNKDTKTKPIIFFDGSLILSFITAVGGTGTFKNLRTNYINLIKELLETCEQTKIPLIAYIDNSRAHDVCDMICNYNNEKKNYHIPDSKIVDSEMDWGDRTSVFYCKRSGVLNDYEQFKEDICFSYIKTNSNSASRIEFPKWVFEETDLFQEIIDIIRAEVIIGKGYIYSLESADAIAVITNKDKNMFYKTFSMVAEKYKLGFSQSQKLTSKLKRR